MPPALPPDTLQDLMALREKLCAAAPKGGERGKLVHRVANGKPDRCACFEPEEPARGRPIEPAGDCPHGVVFAVFDHVGGFADDACFVGGAKRKPRAPSLIGYVHDAHLALSTPTRPAQQRRRASGQKGLAIRAVAHVSLGADFWRAIGTEHDPGIVLSTAMLYVNHLDTRRALRAPGHQHVRCGQKSIGAAAKLQLVFKRGAALRRKPQQVCGGRCSHGGIDGRVINERLAACGLGRLAHFFCSLPSTSPESAAMNASCGTSTRPTIFMRFLPSFCFSSSLRLRLISPP